MVLLLATAILSLLSNTFLPLPFIAGCGINPARVFGPMVLILASGESLAGSGWWVYYTAPFVGGAVAALMFKFIFDHQGEDAEEIKKRDTTTTTKQSGSDIEE